MQPADWVGNPNPPAAVLIGSPLQISRQLRHYIACKEVEVYPTPRPLHPKGSLYWMPPPTSPPHLHPWGHSCPGVMSLGDSQCFISRRVSPPVLGRMTPAAWERLLPGPGMNILSVMKCPHGGALLSNYMRMASPWETFPLCLAEAILSRRSILWTDLSEKEQRKKIWTFAIVTIKCQKRLRCPMPRTICTSWANVKAILKF